MELNLKDVREYLLETNAVEEAESILLHNILNKSNETLKRKAAQDSLNKPETINTVKESTDKLDNLKISDLLGSLEEEYKSKERKRKEEILASQAAAPAVKQPAEVIENLHFFDEIAGKELAELEKKRDWVQLKKLANRYEIDRMNILHRPAEADAPPTTSAPTRTAPIPFPKNTKETMSQLYDLTEEHARKMAQNKAEALSYQRELELLNKGKWSMQSSYLSNGTDSSVTTAQPKPVSVQSNAENISKQNTHTSPAEEGKASHLSIETSSSPSGHIIPAVTSPSYQPDRIQSLLRSVATDQSMHEQREQIAALRQRAVQSDQSLRGDPLVEQLAGLIRHRGDTAAEATLSSQGSGGHSSRRVDRNVSAPRYVDKWLGTPAELHSKKESSGHVVVQQQQTQVSTQQQQVTKGSGENSTAIDTEDGSQQRGRTGLVTQNNIEGGQNNMKNIPKNTQFASDSNNIHPSHKHEHTEDPLHSLITKLLEENKRLQEEKSTYERQQPRRHAADETIVQEDRGRGYYQQHHSKSAGAVRSAERAIPRGLDAFHTGMGSQFRSGGGGGGSGYSPSYLPPQQQQGHSMGYGGNGYALHFGGAPQQGYGGPMHQPSLGYADWGYSQQPQQYQYQQYQQPPFQQHPQASALGMYGGYGAPSTGPTGYGGLQPGLVPPNAAVSGNSADHQQQQPPQLRHASSPMRPPIDANENAESETSNPPGSIAGRNLSNAPLLTLERDKARLNPACAVGAKPTRQELRHMEELRSLQHDIDKIRYQGELEIAQTEYEQSRARRQRELEHEQWLLQKKQELQALKIQQVISKEQRMLRLHQEDQADGASSTENNNKNNVPGGGMKASSSQEVIRSATALARSEALEECGVGRLSIPLDLAAGITVIVDGVVAPRAMQEENQFRIALGIFDRAGKALVRLSASQWQSWSTPSTTSDKEGEGTVQVLKELLTRTLKLSDCKSDLGNSRCLVELQTKDKMSGAQKGIGWTVFPLIRASNGNNSSINTSISKEDIVLCNYVWRSALRKSLSDPAVADPYAASESPVPGAWFVLRVLDTASKQQASGWTLSDSLIRTEKQVLNFYRDVSAGADNSTAAVAIADESEKILEKDPDLRKLFASASKDSLGFSTRSGAAAFDLGGVGEDGGGGLGKGRGGMAAMKAVGMFKSKSKGKMPEIAEEEEGSMTPKPGTSMSSKGNIQPPPGSSAQRGRGTGTPVSPAMAGFGSLSKKVSTAKDKPEPPAATGEDKSKDLLRAADDKSFWFLGKPLGPCSDKFQKGDGVDVYIDSAMFLPDNTTLSRITMRLFTAEKEQLGSVYECFSLSNSPAMSPIFNYKAEVRLTSVNVTLTALLRIDTIDAATLLPASTGYACVKLFANRDRIQPKTATELNACVNTGSFQVPVHAGRIPTSLGVMNDQMLATLPRIPAASLLVRILPAPKSSDGISTLSRNEFPVADWGRLGLDVPAPSYVSGEYSGALCEPSDVELVCYRAKSQIPVESVESALLHAISARPAEALSLPPKPTNNDADAMVGWMKQLLPPHDQMRRSIEYAYAVPYSLETGLQVSIERLYNMPEPGIFTSHSTLYKVITSTSPPGLFYKDPPLYDGVYYTKTHDLDAHQRAPAFTDGYYDFSPSTLSANLYLLLDIRTLRIECKKPGDTPKITVEPPSQRKNYWTLLPLSMEKIPGQGYQYVTSGIFHVPLFEGTIPVEDVLKAGNPYKELCSRLSTKGKGSTNLKVMEGGMLSVRVLNPLLKDLILPELNATKPNIHTEFMEDLLTHAINGNSSSAARIDRFTVDATKLQIGGTNGGKSTATQLPKSCLPDLPSLIRSVNKEFESVTGLMSC